MTSQCVFYTSFATPPIHHVEEQGVLERIDSVICQFVLEYGRFSVNLLLNSDDGEDDTETVIEGDMVSTVVRTEEQCEANDKIPTRVRNGLIIMYTLAHMSSRLKQFSV